MTHISVFISIDGDLLNLNKVFFYTEVECCYKAMQYIMILYIQWQWQNINQISNSQKSKNMHMEFVPLRCQLFCYSLAAIFADDNFKCIFLNENDRISFWISLKFVLRSPFNNNPALVQVMAWRRTGDKPLSEPMVVRLPTHICVTRPQWVKWVSSALAIALVTVPDLALNVSAGGHGDGGCHRNKRKRTGLIRPF